MQYTFSYNEMEAFLEYAKQLMPVVSFNGYKPGDKCIILRHDVDLDFYPAYEVSRIEKDLGISSTFFILLNSPTYNPMSSKIRALLRKMNGDFEIGLHFDPTIYGDVSQDELQRKIEMECDLLWDIVGEPVYSISLHNPSLSGNFPLFKGYINAYAPEFFCDERYISDSMRVDPLQHPYRNKDPYEFVRDAKSFPLQVVLHPEQFLRDGGDYVDTITRFNERMLNTFLHEYVSLLLSYRKEENQ